MLILRVNRNLVLFPKQCFSLFLVDKPDPDVKPFDYTSYVFKKYMGSVYNTLGNLNDNSLLISVDGNFGSGQSVFARHLANRIGFLYVPAPDLDRMCFPKVSNHLEKLSDEFDGTFDYRAMWNQCCLPDRRLITLNEWLMDVDL
ncbi:hypothetical protein ACOME3_005947 [Neoechinorhynchus agilis]